MRLSCKAKYKLEIRDAYVYYENKLSDELANMNLPDFWKTWNAKFKKNVSKQVNINGCTSGNDIANEFAAHFSNVFCKSSVDTVAYNDYICKLNECIVNNFQSSCTVVEDVDFKMIERSVKKLKFGNAGGPDELCAESIHYAHLVLMMHIKHLFKLILMHGYVPHDFGLNISLPLVKDKAGNSNNVR